MSVSGLVVHARADSVASVRAALEQHAGVEVHAASADGRLVVTLDRADDYEATELMSKFQAMDGVLSMALAYSHFENDLAEEERGR